jgi:hypothetical protein
MFENLKKLATEKNLKVGFAILVLVIVIMSLNKMGLYEGMAGKASSDATEKAEAAPMKSTEKKITLSLS